MSRQAHRLALALVISLHSAMNSSAEVGTWYPSLSKMSLRYRGTMPVTYGDGCGRPRNLPPKRERCQASVGIAARFGYCLIASPERYGPRSANLPMMALGILPPMFQPGMTTTSGMSLEARTAPSFWS
jgi:hypothetical protein